MFAMVTSPLEENTAALPAAAPAVECGRPTAAAARWIAAILLIFYGFSKVNGAQFRVIDSELARPLGDVSGFWLTWHYFGYSSAYRLVLAVVEIGGGVLLVI